MPGISLCSCCFARRCGSTRGDNAEIDEDEDGPDLRFQLKELFESGKYTGGNNRHRSAFLQGVKEIVKIQDKISDAEFLELRKFTLQLVCSVYTVNADIL